jgi:hypothetical protein
LKISHSAHPSLRIVFSTKTLTKTVVKAIFNATNNNKLSVFISIHKNEVKAKIFPEIPAKKTLKFLRTVLRRALCLDQRHLAGFSEFIA